MTKSTDSAFNEVENLYAVLGVSLSRLRSFRTDGGAPPSIFLPAIQSWYSEDATEDDVSDTDTDDNSESESDVDAEEGEEKYSNEDLAASSTRRQTASQLSEMIINDENAKQFRSNALDERISRLTEASVVLLLDDAMKV